MPGTVTQAINFARAVYRHAQDGFANVSDAEYERRLTICRGGKWRGVSLPVCIKWRNDRCAKCGCPLAGDKIAKARWRSEGCPLGKWDTELGGPLPPEEATNG